ncbi:MAG: histidine kinase [Chitinophagaceae bacterium]|nr:histidine kinase [Chitinophagaceae bacterium]
MSRIANILSRKGRHAISVLPETTVIDALRIMAEKNIGSIVVMVGDQYLGIMTERDYSRKVILKGKHSDETRVAEIMSTDLPSVNPNDSVEFCMQIMSDKNIRYLPVFDNDKLSGIISMSDVVKETILLQQATISHLESYIHSGV